MTSNLKCPFCQQELCQDYTGVMYCCNEDCEQSADWYGSMILWQELAQVKKDLKTATKALEEIIQDESDEWFYITKNAIEQIKHKE